MAAPNPRLSSAARTGRGDDAVVAGDAFRLVLPHAVGDQLELVAEVVVQNPVGELGVLRDVAQAGARVALLGQRLQGRRGELRPPLGELVDLPARDPVRVPLRYLGHCQVRSFLGRRFKLPAGPVLAGVA